MPDYRGIALPHPRIASAHLDATLTTATEAGPIPGPAVDQGSSAMVLRTAGTQAASDSVTVDVVRGGYPGIGQRAGGFAYTRGGSEYYWDDPGVISGFEFIAFQHATNPSTTDSHYQPKLCTLPDGSVLLVTRTDAPALMVRRYTPDDDTWAAGVEITDDLITDDPLGACLLPMGGEVVHLYHAEVASGQVVLWISQNNGATWSLSNAACLSTVGDLATTGGWLNVVRAGAQIVLAGCGIASGVPDAGLRWISSDGGYRFELIDESGTMDDTTYRQPLPLDGGGFFLPFGTDDAAGVLARQETVGNPYHVISTPFDLSIESAGEVFEGLNYAGNFWRGEDGRYNWLESSGLQGTTTTSETDSQYLAWHRSETAEPETFVEAVGSPLVVRGGSEYLKWLAVTETQGLSIVASEVVAEDTGRDGSIAILYLGGHTTHTAPPGDTTADPDSMYWSTYLPFSLPDSTLLWTKGGTGLNVGVYSDGLRIEAVNTKTLWYEVPANVWEQEDEELLVEFDAHTIESGASGYTGTVNQPRVGVRINYQYSGSWYNFHIQLDDDGFGLYSGTTSLIETAADLSGRVSFRIAIYRDRYAVWYRIPGTRVERAWTLADSGTGLGTTAGAGDHEIEWGILTTSTSGNATITFERFAVCSLPAGALTDTGAKDLPKYPRPLAARPITLPGGLSIEAVGGPARVGDQWQIDTAYQYGLDALDDPSPGKVWRSTADNVALDIVWTITGGAVDTRLPPSIAVALLNSNLNRYKLIGRTTAGADTTLIDCYAQPFDVVGTPTSPVFAFTRTGSTIECTPGSSSGESHYIGENELAGSQVFEISGAKGYRIISNSGGEWKDGATHKPIRIDLDPDDEPESAGASGTCTIVLKDSAGFVNDLDAEYRWLKLEIPAQQTREDYYQIGALVIGELHLFGRQYSEDRHQELTHNVSLSTRRDGTRYAYSRGAQRRAVDFAWREGVDESELWTGHARVETAGGEAVAVAGGTRKLVAGLFRATDGPLLPVAYLPRVPSDVTSDTITQHDLLIYGRVVSQHSSDTVLGDEGVDEVHRINAVRIEEEL